MNKTISSARPAPLSAAVVLALAALAAAMLLVAPSAHALARSVEWTSPPTPSNNSAFTANVGSELDIALAAAGSDAEVKIAAVGSLPDGARLDDGTTGKSTFRWTPATGGDYTVRFVASDGSGGSTSQLTYKIHVDAGTFQPRAFTLTDTKVGHWAVVLRRAKVRVAPKTTARVLTKLALTTSDDTQNIVLVLDSLQLTKTQVWYHIELPILPNNTTGWVLRGNLGRLYTVHTHLYVNRASETASLTRDGKTIFTTRVGVGKSYWPTPAGEFYIRDKLTNFNDPFYGPVAFGTSARSAVLTDWPGGGFVGVHGTNEPQLIPGHISHGCIRMKNPAILRLARLMSVGTPLTVR
jgi:L,D-transpeptidase catalytic domain